MDKFKYLYVIIKPRKRKINNQVQNKIDSITNQTIEKHRE